MMRDYNLSAAQARACHPFATSSLPVAECVPEVVLLLSSASSGMVWMAATKGLRTNTLTCTHESTPVNSCYVT